MIKPKKRFSILCFGLLLILFACKQEPRAIPINSVEIESELVRFDKLFTQNDSISTSQWKKISNQLPYFVSIFNQQILVTDSIESLYAANRFKSYFDSTELSVIVRNEFENFPEFEQFTDVQKRLTVLIPTYEPVKLVTMISGFNYKTMLLDDEIATGLDLYLGDKIDYTGLNSIFFEYTRHRFHRSYIVPDLTTSIVDDLFPDVGEYNTFLKRILYEGKKLALKQGVQPHVDPATIIGMTEEDYQWCEDNEEQIWQYFVSQELIYSNDIHQYKTYVFDGPFSSGMPEEAPALTGNFIGWKIINAYRKNVPNQSFTELFANTNESNILKESNYRP